VRDALHSLLRDGPRLSVGVNKAEPARLPAQLEQLRRSGVEIVHIDIADGEFSQIPPVDAALVGAVGDCFVRDVHLLVADPLPRLVEFDLAGADLLTIHAESRTRPIDALRRMRHLEVDRGVAVNPDTAPSAIEPLLDEVEHILLLASTPDGMPRLGVHELEDRLAAVRALIGSREIAVGVDGGISPATVANVAELGPDLIVAGSAVFNGGDVGENARSMLELIAQAGSQACR
jgi:ribulose-phosphate 3-epimerase